MSHTYKLYFYDDHFANMWRTKASSHTVYQVDGSDDERIDDPLVCKSEVTDADEGELLAECYVGRLMVVIG